MCVWHKILPAATDEKQIAKPSQGANPLRPCACRRCVPRRRRSSWPETSRAAKHSEPTEDNFLRPHSDQQQCLASSSQRDRPGASRNNGRECRNQKNHTSVDSTMNRAASSPSDRATAPAAFRSLLSPARPRTPLGVGRLVLEQRQQQSCIQQRCRGGNMLCRSSLGRPTTYDMRKITSTILGIPALAANSGNGCRFPCSAR